MTKISGSFKVGVSDQLASVLQLVAKSLEDTFRITDPENKRKTVCVDYSAAKGTKVLDVNPDGTDITTLEQLALMHGVGIKVAPMFALEASNASDELIAEAKSVLKTKASNQDAGNFTGAYIMAKVAPEDAARIAVPEGDPSDSMHITLGFLQNPAAEYSSYAQGKIETSVKTAVLRVVANGDWPFEANAFATATFNSDGGPDGDMDPCAVLLVQSDVLAKIHDEITTVLSDELSTKFPIWIPHVSLGYGLDASNFKDRLGPIKFDQVIVSWGNQQDVVSGREAKEFKDVVRSIDGVRKYREPIGTPIKPGSAPIPDGHVRLYHYTDSSNTESIRKHGLLEKHARGDGNLGAGNEPSAGVWASTSNPGNSTHSNKTVVEFHVHPDQISMRAEHPQSSMAGEVPLKQWQMGNHHVILHGDLKPDQIVALHENWHEAYRYMKDNSKDPLNEYAHVTDGDSPELAPYKKAYEQIKKEQGAKSLRAGHSIESKALIRHVESAEGARRYKKPIGSPITAADIRANGNSRERRELARSEAGVGPDAKPSAVAKRAAVAKAAPVKKVAAVRPGRSVPSVTPPARTSAVAKRSNVVPMGGKVNTAGMTPAQLIANQMRPAKVGENRTHDGQPIPPQWQNVQVAKDPSWKVQATGVDSLGRKQSLYNLDFRNQQEAAKHKRVTQMAQAMPKLDKHLTKERVMGDDTAALVYLMRHWGIRVDSTAAGKSAPTVKGHEAIGGSSIQVSHVKVAGNKTHVEFIGKSARVNTYDSNDPLIAAMFKSRMQGKKPGDQIFDTDSNKTIHLIKTVMGDASYKNHDLRTHFATSKAALFISQEPEVPTSPTAFKKVQNKIGDQVAALLNDTRSVALKSYIAPNTWMPLQTHTEMSA